MSKMAELDAAIRERVDYLTEDITAPFTKEWLKRAIVSHTHHGLEREKHIVTRDMVRTVVNDMYDKASS